MNRFFSCLLVFSLLLQAQPVAPSVKNALASISPAELKGDLSFLSSDLLQGRYTPSPGLDIAAEFIASKFRAAGLEPGGNGDYFQLADMVERELPKVSGPLTVIEDSYPRTIDPSKIQVTRVSTSVRIIGAPVLKFTLRDPAKLRGVDLEGKVVLASGLDYSTMPEAERTPAAERARDFDDAIAKSKALLEIIVTRTRHRTAASSFLYAEDVAAPAAPALQVDDPALADAVATPASMTLSLEIPAPHDQHATVKNVIGVLRGSDPSLKSTCVLLTAHYDHIGTTATASGLTMSIPETGDKIYNGANDDGSGTVSVIEIARALSHLHTRRSIVFIAFFGEERGLLGSAYYGRHPLFPIANTVADLNLEQVGRTDSSEGPEIANATVTGYDYSSVTRYLEDAGRSTGIRIYKDDSGSDQYFVRSDNAALAEQGVPAHTVATSFEYPDYHGVGDEWPKIDYENMAQVDRAVALAVLTIANSRKAPEWNADNPKTKPFREAAAAHGTIPHSKP